MICHAQTRCFGVVLYLFVSGLLLSNGGDASTETLSVLEADPKQVEFGAVKHGEEYKQDVQVTNRSSVPAEVASIQTSCTCLAASSTKATLLPGEATTLTVTLDMRQRSTSYTGEVYLLAAKGAGTLLTVKAHSTIDKASVPRMTIDPPAIVFHPTDREGSLVCTAVIGRGVGDLSGDLRFDNVPPFLDVVQIGHAASGALLRLVLSRQEPTPEGETQEITITNTSTGETVRLAVTVEECHRVESLTKSILVSAGRREYRALLEKHVTAWPQLDRFEFKGEGLRVINCMQAANTPQILAMDIERDTSSRGYLTGTLFLYWHGALRPDELRLVAPPLSAVTASAENTRVDNKVR